MFSTLALLAAATIAPASATAALPAGPFDPLTANYHRKTGDYCIRSGWKTATSQTGRPVRAGECANAFEWRERGLTFDRVDRTRRARRVDVAAK